ncbi:hypothetical protein HS088_TW13G00047 [Tripterygium wilfordii]|uniref:Uncharacterized protein n=1 Tax=Tripterygium wilfordii TaxID=458696 RepID=A0A7J7CT73_TRIWF|nr:hypothetical protein HS088_TW13G00047 [Tripterygium wilfordii]
MGACYSGGIKAVSPFHTGFSSKNPSRDVVRYLSHSSSKASSGSIPQTPRSEGELLQSLNLKNFSFSELKTATRNFRPDSVLGEGGFGSVFKGWIDQHSLTAAKPGTGMVIAVKRLNQEGFQGHKEWLVLMHMLLCYVFGVVLLELICGKRAIDKNRPSGQHNLVEWATPYLTNKRRLLHVIDAGLEGQYSLTQAQKVATLALLCLAIEPKSRPNMDEVVRELEQLQEPKDVTKSPKPPSKERRLTGHGLSSDGRTAYPRPSASPHYA